MAKPDQAARRFIPCVGGPCTSRLIYDPPPLEIKDRGGLYILNDDGPQTTWTYLWHPTPPW